MLKACRFSLYLLDSWEKWAFLTLPHCLSIDFPVLKFCVPYTVYSKVPQFLASWEMTDWIIPCGFLIILSLDCQPSSACLVLLKWVSFDTNQFHFLDWNLNRLLVCLPSILWEKSHTSLGFWVSFLEGSLVSWSNPTAVYPLSLLNGRGGSSDLTQEIMDYSLIDQKCIFIVNHTAYVNEWKKTNWNTFVISSIFWSP